MWFTSVVARCKVVADSGWRELQIHHPCATHNPPLMQNSSPQLIVGSILILTVALTIKLTIMEGFATGHCSTGINWLLMVHVACRWQPFCKHHYRWWWCHFLVFGAQCPIWAGKPAMGGIWGLSVWEGRGKMVGRMEKQPAQIFSSHIFPHFLSITLVKKLADNWGDLLGSRRLTNIPLLGGNVHDLLQEDAVCTLVTWLHWWWGFSDDSVVRHVPMSALVKCLKCHGHPKFMEPWDKQLTIRSILGVSPAQSCKQVFSLSGTNIRFWRTQATWQPGTWAMCASFLTWIQISCLADLPSWKRRQNSLAFRCTMRPAITWSGGRRNRIEEVLCLLKIVVPLRQLLVRSKYDLFETQIQIPNCFF